MLGEKKTKGSVKVNVSHWYNKITEAGDFIKGRGLFSSLFGQLNI
jgi:hypothetical protein